MNLFLMLFCYYTTEKGNQFPSLDWMEKSIAVFISGRENFFKERACINSPIDEYCVCDNVNVLFDIEGVMRQQLVDVGQGVRMTRPLGIEKKLLTGDDVFASVSHKGILAVYARGIIQITDLNNGRQVNMKVEDATLIGFYDEMMILLASWKPLREVRVEEVFESSTLETVKEIKDTCSVSPWTDVSLLHVRRVLYYRTIYDHKLYSFNVDTRANTWIDVGRRVDKMASFTGIDCNIRAVFQDYDNRCTYTLNTDNTVTKVNEEQNDLSTLFPSTSDINNINDVVFEYGGELRKNRNRIDTNKLIYFDDYYSVIRVYRDVFLTYDWCKKSWVLVRIITP